MSTVRSVFDQYGFDYLDPMVKTTTSSLPGVRGELDSMALEKKPIFYGAQAHIEIIGGH